MYMTRQRKRQHVGDRLARGEGRHTPAVYRALRTKKTTHTKLAS